MQSCSNRFGSARAGSWFGSVSYLVLVQAGSAFGSSSCSWALQSLAESRRVLLSPCYVVSGENLIVRSTASNFAILLITDKRPRVDWLEANSMVFCTGRNNDQRMLHAVSALNAC